MDGVVRHNSPVQAHLVRASKFRRDKERARSARDWSLFFFFRIMRQSEVDTTADALRVLLATKRDSQTLALKYDLENAALASARGAAALRQATTPSTDEGAAAAETQPSRSLSLAPEPPAKTFLGWLSVLASAERAQFIEAVRELVGAAARRGPRRAGAQEIATQAINSIEAILERGGADPADSANALLSLLDDPAAYAAVLSSFGKSAPEAGLKAVSGGLKTVVLYELLRQGAPAFAHVSSEPRSGVLRSESDEESRDLKSYDDVPINIAFTHTGLATLLLDQTTLASFPDPFKQGMAVRAERLGDTGVNAPEHWEGALGLRSVHGYFTGGFSVGDSDDVPEENWRRLRSDVRDFNDSSTARGADLRRAVGGMARLLGMEILHIELGQDPYDVVNGKAKRAPYRREHFGFRDGVSQPFVDMGLGDTLAGGGTPARNSTWAPVAPGEIYLHERDEDGRFHLLPVNADLRKGATFLVFRKLEQDVVGFRSFLGRAYPDDTHAQTALAAEMMGRWQNGTPLVLSPDVARDYGQDGEAALNDFRYAADDPYGRKCPLGAHIRRTNPRDIGGRNDVRRHRLLRRGISYGGPLLPEASAGDAEKRGMLFIAANARIDLQFETIQGEWINHGELMGQAGLGRCPITGANAAQPEDVFFEADAKSPITEIPGFVRTRGGDYFFAPGVDAVRLLAQGETFAPSAGATPFDGHSMNEAATPSLFDPSRLFKYAALIQGGAFSAIRVGLPADQLAVAGASVARRSMVFVAKYEDVRRVLRGRAKDEDPLEFSVSHYRAAAESMTRGDPILVATDLGSNERDRMKASLDAAWQTLGSGSDLEERVRRIARATLGAALRRVGPSRQVDLIRDFAADTTYAVIAELLGAPGPAWLTELAIALPFSRANVGGLHPDWIAALKGEMPDNPAFTTMQVWSVLILADLIGNMQNQQEIKGLSKKAALEMLSHVEALIERACAAKVRPPRTLLEAFVANEPSSGQSTYYRDAALLLTELAGTALTVVPLTFGSVLASIFDMRLDLPRLIEILTGPPQFGSDGDEGGSGEGLTRLIYEAERFNPNIPIRMRQCVRETKLPSGAIIHEGEWVSSIIQAAAVDKFDEPFRFSLHPFLPGPKRHLDQYFLFGVGDSHRACWGRDKIALMTLQECLVAAGRLQGLQRVAGPRGEVKKLLGVAAGLRARFNRVI